MKVKHVFLSQELISRFAQLRLRVRRSSFRSGTPPDKSASGPSQLPITEGQWWVWSIDAVGVAEIKLLFLFTLGVCVF